MNRILGCVSFAILLLAGRSGIAGAQDNARPVPPFKIFDNLYYAGLDSLGAYVLQTSAGLILIDSLYPETKDYIPKTMPRLGLNPKDIKYVIVTHAHTDHTGGAKAIQDLTGARVGMAEADWDMVARGGYTSSTGQPRVFDPIRRDLVIKDGDTLTLGDTLVKFYVTPGHTPGVTSIEFVVSDQGKKLKAFMFGGIGLNTVNGVKAVQQYIDSVRRVMAIPDVEVNLSNHPNARQLREQRGKVGPEGFRTAMRTLLANAEKKLAAEKN
ncbi:MAG: MBL fold metallo-hydrolase [Acidobacteria bacterium]|nr:MBL fold metallo-hydrolase [Acidobacteriota bacterium]